MRTRLILLVALLALAVSAAAAATPPPSSGQQPQEEKKEPEKKKARKVWTNDDLPGLQQRGVVSIVGQAPAAPAPKAEATGAATGAFPFDELDEGREQRKTLEAELQNSRQALENLRTERVATEDAVRQQALDDAIVTQEQEVTTKEAELQELDTRIAALEKQTKGRKRPKLKPAPKPAAPPAEKPPAEQPQPPPPSF